MSKYISEPSAFQSSRPLSLDELKQMAGCPVWVKVIDHSVFKDPKDDFDGWGMVRKSWVRIWDEKRADLIHIDYDFESYGKEWLAYAMPVKHGRWEWNEYGQMFCSECQAYPELAIEKPFCPNCGTLMTQDDESDVYTKSTIVFVCCKECVSSGRNKDGVLICQNQLCPCYNREVFPKFSCICGESRATHVYEGDNTND